MITLTCNYRYNSNIIEVFEAPHKSTVTPSNELFPLYSEKLTWSIKVDFVCIDDINFYYNWSNIIIIPYMSLYIT